MSAIALTLLRCVYKALRDFVYYGFVLPVQACYDLYKNTAKVCEDKLACLVILAFSLLLSWKRCFRSLVQYGVSMLWVIWFSNHKSMLHAERKTDDPKKAKNALLQESLLESTFHALELITSVLPTVLFKADRVPILGRRFTTGLILITIGFVLSVIWYYRHEKLTSAIQAAEEKLAESSKELTKEMKQKVKKQFCGDSLRNKTLRFSSALGLKLGVFIEAILLLSSKRDKLGLAMVILLTGRAARLRKETTAVADNPNKLLHKSIKSEILSSLWDMVAFW